MNQNFLQKILILLSFILCIKLIINQNVIGFYRIYNPTTNTYDWYKCENDCYTCVIKGESDLICLSCDENKGNYFFEEENNNICYTELTLKDKLSYASSPYYGRSFFWIQNKILQNGHCAMKIVKLALKSQFIN